MDKDQNNFGSGMKTCKNCGVPLDPDTKFCVNCGTPVEQEEPQKKPEAQEVTKEPAAVPKPAETQPPMAAPPASPSSDVPFPDEQYNPPQMSSAPPAAYRHAQTPKQTGVFAGGILGFIVMAALLVGIVVAGLLQGDFFILRNIHVMYIQFMIFGTIACCAVLTTRAKGPDLSIGAVMALTGALIAAFSGSWILGIIIAAACCITIGAANGALIVYLRMPSLFVTLAMTAIVRGIIFFIVGGRPLTVGIKQFSTKFVDFLMMRMGIFELVPLIIFAVAFITVFLLIVLSKLGKPLRRREASDQRKLSFFLAYVISSIIAGILGAYLVAYQSQVSMYTGTGYEMFILFVFAAVTSSRFIDNRVVPVVYAIPATIFYVMLSIFLMFISGGNYIIQMVMAVIAVGMGVVSYIARKDSFKGIVQRM